MTLPPTVALSGHDVHVWSVALDGAGDDLATLARTLSADELRRADAFLSPIDRDRFVACRGTLRRLLARYTGAAAGALTFSYGAAGKPALARAQRRSGLRFNVAHSGAVALIALTRTRRVGVDVETLRPIADLHHLTRMVCSTNERAILDALPPRLRPAAFLRAWTRKEALLKALGHGLQLPPDRVEVTLAPGAPADLVSLDGAPCAAWSLVDLPAAAGTTTAGTIAAVAVERRSPDEAVVVHPMGAVDATCSHRCVRPARRRSGRSRLRRRYLRL